MDRYTRKPKKTALLKARCDSELKESIQLLARLQRLDESDLIRLACAQYAAQHSPKLMAH